MLHRPLGSTDLHIAPLVVGTMARRGDHRSSRAAIYAAALEHGLTTFDTAPLYGLGTAERLLGEALRGVPRRSVQVLGKVGLRWDAGNHGDVLFEVRDADGLLRQVRRNSRPESVREEIGRSLERLQTDYLDLVQIHQPDPQTPIDETMQALVDARREGLIKAIGVSNFSTAQLVAAQRSLGEVPLASLQADYSLLQRRVERELLPRCRSSSVGFLAYSPLAAGYLARAPAADTPPVLREALSRHLVPVAEAHQASQSAIALAWLIARPGVSAAISGISTVDQLIEQAQALRVTLSADEQAQLAAGFAGIPRPDAPVLGPLRRVLKGARRTVGMGLRKLGVDPAALRRRTGREKW